MVFVNFVFAYHLDCDFHTWGPLLWPEFKYCLVSKLDLSLSDLNKQYTFTVYSEDRRNITAVQFNKSPTVEFIPLAIFSEFLNINGFMIGESNVPIIKTGLFTIEFNVIEYLYLVENRIQKIEGDAFVNLPNLKWISIFANQIETIHTNTFKKNRRLELINLQHNRIKILDPSLFANLNNLTEVWLNRNDCVNSDFGESHLSLSSLKNTLGNCYDNCLNDEECASFIVNITETTTEQQIHENECIGHSEFQEFKNQTMTKIIIIIIIYLFLLILYIRYKLSVL
jgi:hypothetical protein